MEDVARVVLGLDAPDVAEEVLHFLDRSGQARVVGVAADDRQLAEAVRQLEPHAVVSDPSLICGEMDGAVLLALSTRESVHTLRAAVNAGARGFFVWPSERQALVEAVASTAAARGAPDRRALVVAVRASRGAAGCTFVATHLAQAFAKRGSTCLLVDRDLMRADLTVALALADKEHRTLADLEPVASELSHRHLSGATFDHPSGFSVLPAPPAAALGPWTERVVPKVVEVAGSSVDVLVLHMPGCLDEPVIQTLAMADRVLEVMAPEATSFHATSRALEVLSDRVEASVGLVLNGAGRGELGPRDVQRAFGAPAVGVIPSDGAVVRACARGRLLPPRGRVGRAFDRLASLLLEEGSTSAEAS